MKRNSLKIAIIAAVLSATAMLPNVAVAQSTATRVTTSAFDSLQRNIQLKYERERTALNQRMAAEKKQLTLALDSERMKLVRSIDQKKQLLIKETDARIARLQASFDGQLSRINKEFEQRYQAIDRFKEQRSSELVKAIDKRRASATTPEQHAQLDSLLKQQIAALEEQAKIERSKVETTHQKVIAAEKIQFESAKQRIIQDANRIEADLNRTIDVELAKLSKAAQARMTALESKFHAAFANIEKRERAEVEALMKRYRIA